MSDTTDSLQPEQTVLVTGAARRIGRHIATDLAACGWKVAIHANNNIEEARRFAHEVCAAGGIAAAFGADLTEPEQIDALVKEAASVLGPLTTLVNCASIFIEDDVRSLDHELFDRHFAIHVRAPSLLAKAFADQRPTNVAGNIINIIDQRVFKLTPQFYSYTLSKSALLTATKTMAQAMAPHIRVNAIGPGPTLKNCRQEDSDFEKQVDALPLRRGPELAEFAKTIRFLVNTPSITGQMIALDGGQHLAWETPDVVGMKE
ncbi:MAG: SDR family oxidoreductase [Stappiaceae bacterium]